MFRAWVWKACSHCRPERSGAGKEADLARAVPHRCAFPVPAGYAPARKPGGRGMTVAKAYFHSTRVHMSMYSSRHTCQRWAPKA